MRLIPRFTLSRLKFCDPVDTGRMFDARMVPLPRPSASLRSARPRFPPRSAMFLSNEEDIRLNVVAAGGGDSSAIFQRSGPLKTSAPPLGTGNTLYRQKMATSPVTPSGRSPSIENNDSAQSSINGNPYFSASFFICRTGPGKPAK